MVVSTDVIALHETGHVFALASVGLYDEFVRIDVGAAQHNTTGRAVQGLTVRSGQSLTDFSMSLSDLATRMSRQELGVQQYAKYMLDNAMDRCFRHLCFFAGGYAIERCLNPDGKGVEVEQRATIDKQEVRRHVLPAMGLGAVSDELFNTFWNWAVDYVKNAIIANEGAVKELVGVVRAHGRAGIDKARMDQLLGGKMQRMAGPVAANDGIVSSARARYEEEFRKAYPGIGHL